MKKPDTLGDTLWRSVGRPRGGRPGAGGAGSRRGTLERYRGVLLVSAVPVLLILAVILFMPRTSPLLFGERAHTLSELRHRGPRYCIVFDAGSTGSRVHVFLFEPPTTTAGSAAHTVAGAGGGGGLRLVKDTFEQLKPGLSAYPDDPAAAAASLQPLLDIALRTVPKEHQAATPVMVKATAGLRMLSGDRAHNILAAVTKLLEAQPFKVAPGAVGILDGQDEGGFAWLTLNYLLERLGGPPENTVAAIDLGGGSVQEAFAVPKKVAQAAPAGYVSELKASGKAYHVYVHSYLGYGLMAGRAKLAAAASGGTTCFPKAYSGIYKYGGKDIDIRGGKDAAPSFDKCSVLVQDVLNGSLACGGPQEECSFNGAWRGSTRDQQRTYYVSSYFWDRATETSIITDKAATTWAVSPLEFSSKAASVCGADLAALATQYSTVKEADRPYLCLDLSYAHTLLTKGFQLKDSDKMTLVKQINYHGQSIEAAWPLGAAINGLEA